MDERTDTVYVANGNDGTVSVLNGARCNAKVTKAAEAGSHDQAVGFLVAAALNPATRTLYVASPQGEVYVIDAAGCNAVTTRGCAGPVRNDEGRPGPAALDIDVATDTVYAANNGVAGNGDTVR